MTGRQAGVAEVPPGYKRTEVGVIPDDWEVMMLPETCWFQEGPGLRQWQFTTSGMKVINVTNLENGVLNLDRTDRHIALSEFSRLYQHFAIDAGDMVMASSGNSYGKTAIVRDLDLPLMMNTSVIRMKPIGKTVYGFLWAFLNSSLFKDQINLMITGGAQPNFGPYHLKRVYLPFPPPREQHAIAAALSDVDGLIGALDALIEKKRAIKQAAMQQLLTGKTRLPGFEGEWIKRQIKDITEIPVTDGPHLTPKFLPEGVPFLSVNNLSSNRVDTTDLRYISLTDHQVFSKKCKPKKWDILLGKAASVGKVAIVDFDWEFNIWSPIALIRIRYPNIPRFIYYSMQAPEVVKQIEYFTNSSSQGNIGMGDIEKLELNLPTPEEQTAIATILSDMDAGIAALEHRREKAVQIKQGMMQQLLTGRIRLPSAGGVSAQ